MAYVPRPPALIACAHCGRLMWAHHARRRYCSCSCNVRASHARNGRSRPARPVPVPTPIPVPVSVSVSPPVARPVSPARPEVVALAFLAAAVLVERVRRPVPTPLMRLEVLARQMAHDLARHHRPRPA